MKKKLFVLLAFVLSVIVPIQSVVFQGNVFAQSNTILKQASQLLTSAEDQENTKKLLVKYKKEAANSESKLKSEKVKKYSKLNKDNLYSVEIDANNVKELSTDKDIEIIEEDASITKTGAETTLDKDKLPWNVEKVKAAALQNEGYYGSGVNVAVFDTGIDLNNKDLNVAGGASFIENAVSYNDDNGHGTAVAGTLAALKNDYNLLGVAPKVNLYSVKVLDKEGTGSYSSLISGIQWAIENNINIMSLSLEGTQYSKILEEAINEASDKGILIIAAAGNEGNLNGIGYPARYPKVVSVGAVDERNKVADFSNKGSELDLVAPGVDVETTYLGLGNKSLKISGTSFAVPHVAGVAAQMWV